MKPFLAMLAGAFLPFLAVLVLFGFGCDEGAPPTQQKSSTKLGVWGLEIKTVEHDKHLFVAGYTGHNQGGMSLLHHPDCPCLRGTLPVERRNP